MASSSAKFRPGFAAPKFAAAGAAADELESYYRNAARGTRNAAAMKKAMDKEIENETDAAAAADVADTASAELEAFNRAALAQGTAEVDIETALADLEAMAAVAAEAAAVEAAARNSAEFRDSAETDLNTADLADELESAELVESMKLARARLAAHNAAQAAKTDDQLRAEVYESARAHVAQVAEVLSGVANILPRLITLCSSVNGTSAQSRKLADMCAKMELDLMMAKRRCEDNSNGNIDINGSDATAEYERLKALADRVGRPAEKALEVLDALSDKLRKAVRDSSCVRSMLNHAVVPEAPKCLARTVHTMCEDVYQSLGLMGDALSRKRKVDTSSDTATRIEEAVAMNADLARLIAE